MLRVSLGVSLLLCCSLTGCLSVETLTSSFRRDLSGQSPPDEGFNLHDPEERPQALATLNRDVIEQEIADTRLRSRVMMSIDSDRRYIGTITKATPESVELTDCLCKDIVPGPDGQPQQRTSYRPSQKLARSTITHFTLMSPPLGKAAAQQVADSSPSTIEAVVLKSGRQQHCCTLFEPAPPVVRATAIDDLREQFASTPRGSQIRLVNQAGRRWQATFLSLEDDRIELLNCLVVESVIDSDGQPSSTLHHIPLESHPLESLTRCEFVAPPSGQFATTDEDLDCGDYCVEGFLDSRGQLHRWGKPHPERMENAHQHSVAKNASALE